MIILKIKIIIIDKSFLQIFRNTVVGYYLGAIIFAPEMWNPKINNWKLNLNYKFN